MAKLSLDGPLGLTRYYSPPVNVRAV
ncbi:uncharacterized protein G2W53_024487 [Senna tora]|uniref:Uncharacterized protein n=1 Tax=Senna tora TaxID=362788 RepID=A0A834TDL7_9FABA|nr:uncharacterized protein G2W53_024487 [Senna tora]